MPVDRMIRMSNAEVDVARAARARTRGTMNFENFRDPVALGDRTD